MNGRLVSVYQAVAAVTLSGFLAAGLAGCKKQQQVADRMGRTSRRVSEPKEFTVSGPIAAGPNDLFEDVAQKAGLAFVHQFCDTRIANIVESNGQGLAVLDYDNDGFPDIYVVNAGPLEGVTHHASGTKREPNRLYRNRGNGAFEDVTEKAGVAGSGYGSAVAAADYDNDGFTDLYVVNVGKNVLYRNRGNGTFEDVTDKAGVGDPGTGIGAVFVDVDGDQKLDLVVANYLTYDPNYKLYYNPDAYPGPLAYKPEFNVLYRNRGDGTFENTSEKSGLRIPGHRAMSVAAFDFDLDGDQDLYICNDATPNLLLVNDGKGRFQDVALKLAVAFNALGEAAGSMTAAVGDCNGDMIPDMLVSRLGYGSLYVGSRERVFTDRMMASGLGSITAQYVGWGSNFLDFDNDGDLDALIANGDAHHMVGWEPLLLENDGNGNFTDAADKGGTFFRARLRARPSVVLDFDNDGRLDILIGALADRLFLLRNRCNLGNHWITLDLQGVKSNRDGFGTKITVSAGSRQFYAEARCPAAFLSQSDRRVHFGLGSAAKVEKIELRWPSGTTQVLKDVAADQTLKVREL
jgi:hypothetical protein